MSLALLLAAPIMLLNIASTIANTGQVLRNRSVDGIAVPTVLMSSYCALSWIVYGSNDHNVLQVVANTVAGAGFVAILCIAHFTKAMHALRMVAGLGAYCAAAGILMSFTGLAGLGIAVSALTFVTRAPQIFKAWRSPGGVGLSVPGLVMDASQCTLWLVVGLSISNPWTVLTSLYCLAASFFTAYRTATANGAVVHTTPISVAADDLVAA